MATTRAPQPARKRAGRYHHGDLRQALMRAALRTIQKHGVEALTLRGVAEDLGVSRTAMYRHFADKSALLAAVAREGFRTFRLSLAEAWEQGGKGRTGFEAMGVAYVRFGIQNPSYYRVMFGGFLEWRESEPELMAEGAAAFSVLLEAIVEQQRDALIRPDDPQQLARYIWSVVHGIAMLAIDGQLPQSEVETEALTRFAIERIRAGIGNR